MDLKFGILNCYADEPELASSASYFLQFIDSATIINICHNEKIENIKKYDGYIISGSRYCHEDKLPWFSYLEKLIYLIHENEIPCLAVCFGHQFVAKIFGGKTIINLSGEEGFQNIPTRYSDENIELFDGIPNPVKVYQSHKDAVLKSPKGSINTLINDRCVQYFQYDSIYSIQSHPEISVQTAVKIAQRDNQNITVILNGINEENIQSQKILYNFIKIVKRSKKFKKLPSIS